ncbi:thermonuclease family protein [Palleronia sp. KMU-117]|uniref:thermonuclease family protein n=1 Tax=Palleronia sp. KMU-117 TaxID=3434108 RepID=UPI003D74009B
MSRRRNTVLPVDPARRSRQRHPVDPPRRRRRRRAPDPVRALKAVMVVGGLALLFLPQLADMAQGVARTLWSPPEACQVLNVIDGDTVTILCPATGVERARIVNVDTPELFSPSCPQEYLLAMRAKWELRRLIWTADEITIVKRGLDRYDRRLVTLLRDGADIGRPLIEAGLARPYGGGARESWCQG